MMQDDLFLIIKTNSYVGNFERELMAFVFGLLEDEEAKSDYEDELNSFYKDLVESPLNDDYNGEESPMFKYIDSSYFGRRYSEYHCFEIMSHPENEKYSCDSIIIGTNKKKLPEEYYNFIVQRLNKFSEYMTTKTYPQEGIEILDVSYFELKFNRKEF